jgi:hypothetical protein
MSNYCLNLLTILPRPDKNPAQFETVIQALRSPNSPIDFEQILPIPAPLKDIHRGRTLIDGSYHSHWREDALPDGGVQKHPVSESELIHLREKYGADNPQEWCRLNWSTKWSAECYCGDWEANAIRFDTPWVPPRRFVRTLSRRFPDFRFELCYVEPHDEINGRTLFCGGVEWQREEYFMESDSGRENAERVGISLPEAEVELETVEA